jgi:putative methyltransferase (TIGR04325 family)
MAMPQLRGVARGQGHRRLTRDPSVSWPGRLRRGVGRVVPRLREWEYVPEGWARQHVDARIKGWNADGVVEAYRRKLPAFREALQGTGPIDFPTSPALRTRRGPEWEQRALLAYAYALALASRGTDRLSMLDWGGGVGLFYLLSRALLPPEVEIDYHCKEVPALCAYGREVLPAARFYEDESCLDARYDFVVASSSLQYTEDWQRLLERLAAATCGYLFLTRVPVVPTSRSFVVLQRVGSYGLGTAYLSWVFNQSELVGTAVGAGMELVREFVFGYRPPIRGAPEQDETRGFLFRVPTA